MREGGRMGGGRGQIRGGKKGGREEAGTPCTRPYVFYGKVGIS